MKKLKIRFNVAMLIAIFTPPALAVTNDGTAGTNIVAPIALNYMAGLRFGDFASHPTQSGTIEIQTDSTKVCSSNLTCFGTSPTGAGTFTVTGADGASYNITVPASVTIIGSGAAAGQSMTATLTGSKTSGTLTSGSDEFTVGGTLTVSANQAVGVYSSMFTVTVEYQ